MDRHLKNIIALGKEHYEKREYDKAERYLKEALSHTDLHFADVYNMMGVIYHDRGRFLDAQASFEEALQVNPHYTEAALNLAVTLNDLGRYDDAKRIYQAISLREEGKKDPFVKGKLANLHAELATAYRDANMLPDAIVEYRKALLLCPQFADLRLKLSQVYLQKGDIPAAKFELEEAIAQRPNHVPAYIALGVLHITQGSPELAKRSWEHALKIDPENATAQMYLRLSKPPQPLSSTPPGSHNP